MFVIFLGAGMKDDDEGWMDTDDYTFDQDLEDEGEVLAT